MSRVGAGWIPALMALTAISGPGAAGDEVDPRAYWAPVIVQHQDRGLIESYPVPFGDDGHGEFTVYSWQAGEAERRWFGYLWQYVSGVELSVVLEVEDRNEEARIAGALLVDAESCRWAPGETLRRVRDAVGLHPVFSVRGKRVGTGLGDLEPVLPEDGVIDWTEARLDGRRFMRAWQRQPHLPRGTPASFGVVLRHEPAGGYRQAGRTGQGNTPHHWNLLAYRLREIEAGEPRLGDPPSDPSAWPCAGLLEDPAAAVERARSEAESD